MAWSTSRIFAATIEAALENAHPINLGADTLRAALYTNAITPDATVALALTAYNAGQWATANEVYDGANWLQGGQALSGVTSGIVGSAYRLDAADLVQTGPSVTLAGVSGCLVYDDTVPGDYGVSFHAFGGTYGVASGTFTVVWNAAGIMTITV